MTAFIAASLCIIRNATMEERSLSDTSLTTTFQLLKTFKDRPLFRDGFLGEYFQNRSRSCFLLWIVLYIVAIDKYLAMVLPSRRINPSPSRSILQNDNCKLYSAVYYCSLQMPLGNCTFLLVFIFSIFIPLFKSKYLI